MRRSGDLASSAWLPTFTGGLPRLGAAETWETLQSTCEGAPREALVCLDVALAGALNDVLGEWRRLAGVTVPAGLGRGEPVPHILFVERWLATAGPPRVQRPEPRRVGCQHLVGQDQRAAGIPAELEFRVGEHDAPLACDCLGP